ncbi:cysteine-rich receptor-like protein kinase 8 [Tanacetum coccineum]
MAGPSTNSTNSNDNDEISSNHPLYLHQTDHPGLLLISKKLTGSDNYSSWKRSIMIALNAKNKMKLVNGEFPEPSIESNLRAIWESNNDMLISWILNIMKATPISEVKFCLCNLYPQLQKPILWPSTSYLQIYTLPRQSNLNTNSERRNNVNLNTSYERRSVFRKGAYYGNYRKEGHYQEECYKIVGYPVGHPLYGKYQPPKVNKASSDSRPPRVVNMVIRQEDTRAQTSASTVQDPTQNNDGYVSARMDQLQNQINQDQNKRTAHGTLCDGLYFLTPTLSNPLMLGFNN